jgi:hypothetical protein
MSIIIIFGNYSNKILLNFDFNDKKIVFFDYLDNHWEIASRMCFLIIRGHSILLNFAVLKKKTSPLQKESIVIATAATTTTQTFKYFRHMSYQPCLKYANYCYCYC